MDRSIHKGQLNGIPRPIRLAASRLFVGLYVVYARRFYLHRQDACVGNSGVYHQPESLQDCIVSVYLSHPRKVMACPAHLLLCVK